jgi:hypothetical protein
VLVSIGPETTPADVGDLLLAYAEAVDRLRRTAGMR